MKEKRCKLVFLMGCLRLTYDDYLPTLKVAKALFLSEEKTDAGSYLYGFNGLEKDDEVMGGGNSYTTFFRQYDPRLGRWLSIDSKFQSYPGTSPYVAFNNNPIFFTDPFGDDPPENFTTMSNTKDGSSLSVPSNTTKALDKDGKVESFQFDGVKFSATYDSKGNFESYKNDKLGVYTSPEIHISSDRREENHTNPNGNEGPLMLLEVDVKNTHAEEIRIVQTAICYECEDVLADDLLGVKYWVETPLETDNGVPYFYADEQLDGDFDALLGATPNWNIMIADHAHKADDEKMIIFSTTIVAKNFMGTGKDYALSTIYWGYSGGNPIKNSSASGDVKFEKTGPIAKIIIKSYYPNYVLK